MRITKALMLSALLMLAAAGSRADTAALQPIESAVQSNGGSTLDGSTTLDNSNPTPAPAANYFAVTYGRITFTSCTWYRPCFQSSPPEPIVISPQADLTTTTHAPEPASLALFGSGLIAVVAAVRRKLRGPRG